MTLAGNFAEVGLGQAEVMSFVLAHSLLHEAGVCNHRVWRLSSLSEQEKHRLFSFLGSFLEERVVRKVLFPHLFAEG